MAGIFGHLSLDTCLMSDTPMARRFCLHRVNKRIETMYLRFSMTYRIKIICIDMSDRTPSVLQFEIYIRSEPH